MTPQQVGLVKQGFKLFTTEGDKLPVDGLAEAMRSLGANPSKAQMEEYEAEIAANNQTDIDFPEFLTLMSRQKKKVDENGGEDEELAQAFKVFNRSQSGAVDAAEIVAFYKSIGQDVAEDDASDWVRDFDKDGDDKLNFEVSSHGPLSALAPCPVPIHVCVCTCSSGPCLLREPVY
jgi:Ca2+-binding EF-hand superfamily protein